MELGQLIVDVGKLVAFHCDKYLASRHPDLPSHFLENAIKESINSKARLLHYFPMTQKEVEPTPDGGNLDSWCGLHIDHSMVMKI